jgi:hypothetical protein
VLPIINPPRNFRTPQSEPHSAFTPLKKPQSSQISPPLSPQPPSNSWRADLEMAPKRSNEKDRKGKESQPSSREWTHSKCSNNDPMKLVSEGLLQEKSLVNWRPCFREPLPMENVDEIVTFYHFAERGLPPPLALSSEAFFISTGLSSITSTQIQFATLPSSSNFAKLSLELNPTGIFSASFSE